MTQLRTTFTFLLILTCVLIVAGCIFQPPAENRTSNISVNVTPFTPVVTPVQTQCPPLIGTSLPVWLTMNPTADHHLGDIFEVNGTIQQKNRTVENAAKIYVQMECYSPGYRLIWPKGIAIQYPSDCDVKIWSYQVNLSRECPIGECRFFAYTIEDGGSRSAIFNVTPPNSDTPLSGGRS